MIYMKIITVIPISKGIMSDALSYFTKEDVSPGAIIEVPVKNKKVPGLVIQSRNAKDIKAEIRSADFSLRKADKVVQESFFLPSFLEAVTKSADYFASTPGMIMSHLFPKIILSLSNKKIDSHGKKIDTDPELKIDSYVLQEPDLERYSFYKSLIRENFARKSSVLFILPTIADIEKAIPQVEKGIEDYIIVFHSRLSKKTLLENWEKTLEENHPVLIVATPGFMSLPKNNIKTIIIDKENSSHYKTDSRPFLDYRIFAEFYAKALGAKLILGDLVLRSETIFRTEKDELLPVSPIKYRSFSEADQYLIDNSIPEEARDKTFEIVHKDFLKILSKADKSGEKTFIMVGRRGLYPTTICNDCGHLITCPDCGSPMVIHSRDKKENHFVCHRCGRFEESPDKCRNCGSWKLATLGIGIERIAKEIKKSLPDKQIFILDSDNAKTPKMAKEIAKKFMESPGSILLGTEMAMQYLKDPIENTAVAGVDGLFTIPDFRINEKIFGLLLRVRTLAIKKFIIQTRNTKDKIFDHVMKGNLLEFFREELEDRGRFSYPPFSVLIKISAPSPSARTESQIEKLASELEPWKPTLYPTVAMGNKKTTNVLLKLKSNKWPDTELLKILRSTKQDINVEVDPASLL